MTMYNVLRAPNDHSGQGDELSISTCSLMLDMPPVRIDKGSPAGHSASCI